MDIEEMIDFYRDRRVLITGHTGFKGTWLTQILLSAGAIVTGYALKPSTQPNLYTLSEMEAHKKLISVIGDVRDLEHMKRVFLEAQPELVFHLAAQPIVRDSYKNPVETYEINVMGTVNMLECVRLSVPGAELNSESKWLGVRSVLNVTTDKVYKNKEWCWGYRENEPLDGYDPYSNSKSCSELVTHSYRDSFFKDGTVRISTMRAGNVIGGGDFANDRIVPDCVRAAEMAYRTGEDVVIPVRNPYSMRPYQHVLEPLFAYLMVAMKQYKDIRYAGCYNVGPDDDDCIRTGELADLFCKKWREAAETSSQIMRGDVEEKNAVHEAAFLKLDNSKLKSVFGWRPHWHIDRAMEETVRFTKEWMYGGNIAEELEREIGEYKMADQKNCFESI